MSQRFSTSTICTLYDGMWYAGFPHDLPPELQSWYDWCTIDSTNIMTRLTLFLLAQSTVVDWHQNTNVSKTSKLHIHMFKGLKIWSTLFVISIVGLIVKWSRMWEPSRRPCSEFALIYISQIKKFMGPTLGPSGSCRSQVGPMLDPWTLNHFVWDTIVPTCRNVKCGFAEP